MLQTDGSASTRPSASWGVVPAGSDSGDSCGLLVSKVKVLLGILPSTCALRRPVVQRWARRWARHQAAAAVFCKQGAAVLRYKQPCNKSQAMQHSRRAAAALQAGSSSHEPSAHLVQVEVDGRGRARRRLFVNQPHAPAAVDGANHLEVAAGVGVVVVAAAAAAAALSKRAALNKWRGVLAWHNCNST